MFDVESVSYFIHGLVNSELTMDITLLEWLVFEVRLQ